MSEELEEQASLYVLAMLEPNESSAFEAQLAANAELRRYVDDLRESTAKYAHAAQLRVPPPDLEGRIQKAIREESPVARRTGLSSMNWLPWALAASLALACAWLAADRAHNQKRIARLEKRDAIAQIQIASLASQLPSAPNATAVVIWDADKQEGVLKVNNVPPSEADQDYQLWIVDPEYKQPVNAGVFAVANKGSKEVRFKPKAVVKTANGFAVSLERKGGVSKAEGPMVLAGK